MDIFVPIQLVAKVNQGGMMYLLDKHHRNICGTGGINGTMRLQHTVFITRHIINRTHGAIINEYTGLNVDHDQRGTDCDQVSSLFFQIYHLLQSHSVH